MSYYDYAFEAPIERLAIGNGAKTLYYCVIILPDWCARELPFALYPKLRIIGELNDYPIRGAWNPVADGRKYFILSSKFLKAANLAIGDMAEMRFNIDDQDYVDVPTELEARLEMDDKLQKIWEQLTSGKKRFYSHQISSAKQAKTREKRLEKLISELKVEALERL